MCQRLQPRLQARLMSGLNGVKIQQQGHTISVSPGQVPWKPLTKGLKGTLAQEERHATLIAMQS